MLLGDVTRVVSSVLDQVDRDEAVRLLSSLVSASNAVTEATTLDESLREVSELGRTLTGARFGAVGVVDDSGAILWASPEAAKARGWKPRARLVAMSNVGDSPTLMLNAPVPAALKVLAKAGLTVDDIDLWEINEAFAVVAEKFIRDLKLDRDKVNVNGGSIALGHPIGATGAMLIGTVLDELERRNLRRGLVTMCAAGGMAPAIIIERL